MAILRRLTTGESADKNRLPGLPQSVFVLIEPVLRISEPDEPGQYDVLAFPEALCGAVVRTAQNSEALFGCKR